MNNHIEVHRAEYDPEFVVIAQHMEHGTDTVIIHVNRVQSVIDDLQTLIDVPQKDRYAEYVKAGMNAKSAYLNTLKDVEVI